MLKKKQFTSHLEQDSKAIDSLLGLRKELKTPPSFIVQTKAALFQKIELDHSPVKGAAWYSVPNGLKRLAALTTAGVILASAFFSTSLFSPSLTMAYVGEFDAVHGDVFIHRAEGTLRAKLKDKIFEGDTIEVASSSNAHITFAGEAKTELAANTKLFVEDIITTTVESAISSEVHLALKEGTFTQKKSDKVNDLVATGISVTTSSGVVKATAYADFELRSDENNVIALSVRSEGVSVVKNSGSIEQEQILASGQSVTLQRDPSGVVVTADTGIIATATGSLIAAIERVKVDPVLKPTGQTAPVLPSQSRTIEVSESTSVTTATSVTMPSKPALDLRVAQVFEAIRPRLDIAEVKLNQALSYHVNGEKEKALIAMEGYVSTVGDIYRSITPSKNSQDSTNSPSDRQISRTLDRAVEKSALSKAYDGLVAMQQDLDKDSEDYMNSLASLELLSKAEAALRIDIAQEKQVIAKVDTQSRSSNLLSLQDQPEPVEAPQMDAPEEKVNVISYTKKIQGDVYAQARAIVALEDGKERSSEFLKLLGRIPNEERNIVLLERIERIVPENLRGFIAVKIHAIKYPEAK